MAITIKTGVVYYTMLEYVKKNLSCIFPAQDHGKGCLYADEIYDTVQTMNISQTLNYSILLIIMEAFSLIVYLATDFTGRAVSMLSFTMLLFLLFIAFNIVYCKYLLKQQRTCSTRRRLKHHTYFFTAIFALYCIAVNHICLQSRLTAESVLMFYIYIAAGPIYSLKEALASVLATALAAIPAFRAHHVPPALYSNLFLYSFISLFLSQMRCHIIVSNLQMVRKARDEQVCLQERADKDPLTQLFNRNGYSLRLEELIPYSIRLHVPVAVIMIDIDYFKQYNDTYGHVQGDECLKKVAAALSGSIHRENDLICRFGGEEFQILLCDVHPSDAIKVGDRLRKSVADLKIPAANRSASPFVTISAGVVSTVLTSMDDYHKLVRAADDELYYAKSHGKNMISFRELNPVPSSDLSLEDKLEHAKLIYDSIPFPFAIIQIQAKDGQACDFSYVYVNEACARLECRSRNILYRKSFLSHYPDADTRRLPAYYETAMHGGRQMFYDFSPERSKYLKIECFQFHEGYCGCLIEDVTDQHYFELYGNNELGLLNQVVNGGILLTSYQAESPEVIYMNSRLLHALGYCSLSEYKLLSGGSLSFLRQLHPDDTHTFQETMTVFSTDDTVRSCIIRIRRKDGAWLWFMLRGKLIIDEHKNPLNLFTVYHITRQLKQLGQMVPQVDGDSRISL